jgi:hypothetical protein
MAKGLLLPKDGKVTITGMEKRVHEYLRKFGMGRRLCVTAKTLRDQAGSVVLVPVDSEVGDEIWLFRGTGSAYVLRKIGYREYVVVGEACEYLFCLRSTGCFLD